jgi:hypothetical protein
MELAFTVLMCTQEDGKRLAQSVEEAQDEVEVYFFRSVPR